MYNVERCATWQLLLAWELKDTARLDEAQATLDRLVKKELHGLGDWESQFASMLAQAWEVSEVPVRINSDLGGRVSAKLAPSRLKSIRQGNDSETSNTVSPNTGASMCSPIPAPGVIGALLKD